MGYASVSIMVDPHKTAVIVNPAARGGWVAKHWRDLKSQITGVLGSVEFRLTEAPGHAAEIAKHVALEGYETVVSFGGDGTLSEIVDGIMQEQAGRRVSLGVLHAGTGGDFRRMIQSSDDLLSACKVVQDGQPIDVDVGLVSYIQDDGARMCRHFLNITSMGMSGLVDRLVAQSKRRAGGSVAYLTATLRAQVRYKPARVRLHVDGESRGEYAVSVLCVCNGRWAGGGMMFAPEARVADGEFDVVVIRAASTIRGLPVMVGLYRGRHTRSALVEVFRGRHIEVEVLENTAWMDVDGEAPGVGPSEFRMLEKAIRIIGIDPEFL